MPYNPPTVTGEQTVNTGRAYAVEAYQGPEPGLRIDMWTGNGDDGLGVTMWWAQPLELTFKPNALMQVSGEKVSSDAELIGLDGIGTPLEGDGETLLGSTAYVIVPDLFSAEGFYTPDQVFTITTGAPAADQVFKVTKLADPPDQVFSVATFAEPPDQVFGVQAITNYAVATAEPPFTVTVFAEPADQVFQVITGAPAPDRTFIVDRGPSAPDQVLEVLSIDRYDVTVSWAIPDRSFFVEVGPNPPPVPDQIFGVSVGGPDAPPIPTPDEIFNVSTGPAVPTRIYTVLAVERSFEVTAGLPPFVVTVGPEVPAQVFSVETGATPPDEIFGVAVGPSIPDQVFGVEVVNTYNVEAWDSPALYAVTNLGNVSYQFTGEGLAAQANPDISHTVGQLVTFSVNAPSHPFWVCDLQTTGGCDPAPAWAWQLDNNGTTAAQVRVRFNTPGTYWYNCGVHASMAGRIVVPSAILTYQVTNSGTIDYAFAGDAVGTDPTLSVQVGERLDFQMNAPGHPLWIKDVEAAGPGNASEPWADYLRNNGEDVGTVSVVFNTPGTYFYNCQYHSGMRGTIVVT